MEGIGLEYDNIDNQNLKSWNVRSSHEKYGISSLDYILIIVC